MRARRCSSSAAPLLLIVAWCCLPEICESYGPFDVRKDLNEQREQSVWLGQRSKRGIPRDSRQKQSVSECVHPSTCRNIHRLDSQGICICNNTSSFAQITQLTLQTRLDSRGSRGLLIQNSCRHRLDRPGCLSKTPASYGLAITGIFTIQKHPTYKQGKRWMHFVLKACDLAPSLTSILHER